MGKFESRYKSWIVPSNDAFYRTNEAFRELEIVDWHFRVNMYEGDTVYIYHGQHTQRIIQKTEVVEANVSEENRIDDSVYFIKPTDYHNFSGKKIYRLKLIGTNTAKEQLNLDQLREFGLKGNIQGPRTISGNLLEYINSVF